MRPLSFTIQISERPVYVPNSGPPMAPISLVPENEDTGWVIVDTVEFRGVSQYIVTPKDNPVHRRVVRKEHILAYVSAKAHEDYEYGLYKLREEEEEKQKEARLLAKAAKIKARRLAQGQARGEARVKTRAAILNLARVEGGRTATPIMYSSASDIDSEGPYREISTTQLTLAKRKHTLFYSNATEAPMKRRAITLSGPGLSQQRMPQPFTGLPQRGLPPPTITGDDVNEGNDSLGEYETLSILMIPKQEQSHPDYRPILPPPKPTSSSSRSSSTQIGPTTSSQAPVHAFSRPAWNNSGPRRHTSNELPKRSSSADAQQNISAANGKERPEISHRGIHLPILPSSRSLKTQLSSTEIASIKHPLVDNRSSRDFSHFPFGNDSENVSGSSSTLIPPKTRVKCESIEEKSHLVLNKASNAKHSSKRTPRRIHSTLIGNGKLEDQETHSRLSESHPVRTTTQRHQNIPKQTKMGFQDPTKQNGLSESDGDAENGNDDGDEAWQIHGLLNDEMRLVNGDLIHYYLVDWVGDWDPTWEPEANVSSTAVKAYEKKQEVLFQDLNRTANGVSSSNDKRGHAKSSGTLANGVQKKETAGDSDEALVVSTSAPIFLAPTKVLDFPASSATKGKGEVEAD